MKNGTSWTRGSKRHLINFSKLPPITLRVSPMGKIKRHAISIAVATLFGVLLPTTSVADTDPFPNLNYGDTIPGYEVWDYSSRTWEEFTQTDAYKALVCPAGSELGGIHGYRSGVGRYNKANCWKNVKSAAELAAQAADEEFQRAINEAQRVAEEESRAWNEANPGRQKCVQWGPIRHPTGVGESSGGVCANPVPAGTAPSASASVEAPSVGEGDVGSGSTPSASPETSPTTTSNPVSSSPTTGLEPDPAPSGGVDYRGSGYPYTVIVLGQVGISGCPSGFQAANGLISDVSTRKVYTECWPERAWTAYRLGGDAWELFKATGGSYDPSVEVERRSKVELLKSKAKEVAEAAARTTLGIERCSSWSGFGESGRECAYAYVSPVSSSATAPSSSTASPVTTSVTVRSSTESASTPSSNSPSAVETSTSSSVSSSISVALDTVQVSGTSVQVARTALSVTSDPVEAASISALAEGITEVRTVQRSLLQTMPRDPALSYRVTSTTPSVCLASSWRVRIMNPGLCILNVEITDSSGNSYEIIKRMRRVF